MKNNNEKKKEVSLREGEEGLDMFEPFFDNIWGIPSIRHEHRRFEQMMKTDVKEKGDKYEIEIDIPGYDKKDIGIDINNGYLTVSAQKSTCRDEKDNEGNYIRKERSYGTCSRSFYIGEIKEEDIKAKLERGVLNITVPKDQSQIKKSKRIEIQ